MCECVCECECVCVCGGGGWPNQAPKPLLSSACGKGLGFLFDFGPSRQITKSYVYIDFGCAEGGGQGGQVCRSEM